MKATFTIDFGSSGGSQTLNLDHQVWTSTCANDTIGSNGSIKYGDCLSRTLHVDATNSLHPEAGSGSASVTINVNPNAELLQTPQAIIGFPAFGAGFGTLCGKATSVNALGHVIDHDLDTTQPVSWYSDTFARHGLDPNADPGTQIGSDLTPTLPIELGVQILRLIAKDDAGHQGLHEIPITVTDTCVK